MPERKRLNFLNWNNKNPTDCNSTLEISAKAFPTKHQSISDRQIGPNHVISAVVKGNAYGQEFSQMVRQSQKKPEFRHFK